jgi:hypothetical protein
LWDSNTYSIRKWSRKSNISRPMTYTTHTELRKAGPTDTPVCV